MCGSFDFVNINMLHIAICTVGWTKQDILEVWKFKLVSDI